MCTAKAPTPQPVTQKDPQYLRNPWLDGMSLSSPATAGRNSLRNDPTSSGSANWSPFSTPSSSRAAPPVTAMSLPPPTVQLPKPVFGSLGMTMKNMGMQKTG